MRRLLYVASFLIALSSCSGSTPEQAAAEAAKSYYDLLREGYYEGFLEGKAGVDSLPVPYCEQLLKVGQQYMADLVRKHKGISEVRISDNVGRTDTSLHLTHAFLLLCYGDSTQEEITVPMVEVGGVWKMK